MSSQDKEKVSQEPTQYTVEQKAREEGWKLHYDTSKHLTTLNTGSILILVTFLEKLFTNPKWKVLVIVAFGLFVASIMTAVFSMVGFAAAIRELGWRKKFEETTDIVITIISIMCFLVGILCLIVFAVINLYE